MTNNYINSIVDMGAMLSKSRLLSTVPRWTIVPTIQKQNVAEHSYHVIMLSLVLSTYWDLKVSKFILHNLMIYAATHDLSESVLGDIPTPGKKLIGDDVNIASNKVFNNTDVTSDISIIVKCADCIEALLFLSEEKQMGNTRVSGVYIDIFNNFCKEWAKFAWDVGKYGEKPSATEIVASIKSSSIEIPLPGLKNYG